MNLQSRKNWRSITRLDVIYQGWGEEFLLGTLASAAQKGQFLFEYSREAIQRGLELSPLYQPVSSDTFSNFESYQEGLPGFIFDSLPDGWGRLLSDRLLRRNNIDPLAVSSLDRLAMLGNKTMGALVYKPVLALYDQTSGEYNINDLLTLAEQIRIEAAGQESEVLPELVRLGGSPHGARPKALVEYDPVSGRMGTHSFENSVSWLVKFPGDNEDISVCAIEEIYARLARKAGIDFPESKWFPLANGLAAFGVRRFDRIKNMRVPVLSMAGALQADFRLPSLDYTDILRATGMITRSQRQREIQARQMIFNVVLNNRDDHAKNFAFALNKEGEWEVSKAYDLTFQDGPGGEHQTSVSGYGRDITLAALIATAQKAEVSEAFIRQTTEEICEVAEEFSKMAQQSEWAIPEDKVKMIAKRISHNMASLKG
jgi:serine/threonine-protein kinase HipA